MSFLKYTYIIFKIVEMCMRFFQQALVTLKPSPIIGFHSLRQDQALVGLKRANNCI